MKNLYLPLLFARLDVLFKKGAAAILQLKSPSFQRDKFLYGMEELRKHIESILPINDAEFDYIKTFFLLKRVKKGQYLLNEGDQVKHEYLVMRGVYKVFFEDERMREYIVQFAQENCWMSDYNAFFKREQATMYIECIEEGEVLCLTDHAREKLSSELAKMDHFFTVERSNNYIALEQRVKLLLRNRPLQRYEEFSKLYPGLINRIPKKIIAQYLGLCRETLSRLYITAGNRGEAIKAVI